MAWRFFASAASAAPVVPRGTLQDGIVFTGTAGEDDATAASDGEWWIFSGMIGDMIDIDINRTEAAPDLAAVLFSGDATGVDVDMFGNGLVDEFLFLPPGQVFGPIETIAFADDTEDDAFGGPFGDPRFTLALPSTGTFTLLVSALNEPGDYEIITRGISAAPTPVSEPSALALLGMGLAGLGISRRRKK